MKNMNQSRVIKLFSVVLLFSFTLMSCGDDPVSQKGDPPVLPQFDNIEPDLSYFEANPPQNSNTNYAEAYYFGIGMGSVALSSQTYLSFLSLASNEDAKYKDGQWVWEYSYSYEGETIDIRLVAEETGNSVVWEMLWSYDDGQGNSFSDYKVIEGEVANDGSSGNWTFNTLNPDTNEEEPSLVANWTSSGANNIEVVTEFYDSNTLLATYTFSQNDNEFTVLFEDSQQQDDVLVFWDDEALTGYYQVGSDTSSRKCWDSNYQDVTCADVGY